MSEPKDKGKDAPPTSQEKRSGRAGFDERGNSVWEWQLETGVYSRDVSTQKLKKLELGDLSIAETAANKRPPGLGGERPGASGGGFNPYDSAARGGGGFDPYDSAGASAGGRQQPTPARKPADLKKLEEWMKAKKRAEENKDD